MQKFQFQCPTSWIKKLIDLSQLFAVCCLLIVLFASCSVKKEKIYRKTMIRMDTLVAISVVADSPERADAAINSAFDEIGSLGRLLNFFSASSELSSINKNAGISEVRVSPVTLDVIEKAIYVSENTNGAFDPTIGPEISLWDFHSRKIPDDKTIRERLPLVNYRLIKVDKNKSTVYLEKKGMLMDLGAIAKGYAADKAVEELKKKGIKAGLVAVAGDIRAFGLKPDGKPWRIGIRSPRPRNNGDEIMATVELTDMAISTSGDYERYFISDGKRYHHILDPKTGRSADGCRSVTVIAKKGFQTDAFSTGVFVLGPEKGKEVLKHMGFDGVIVEKSGNIETTPGLKGRIEFKRND
jgi:thiamine biosynthesis lipoprotein